MAQVMSLVRDARDGRLPDISIDTHDADALGTFVKHLRRELKGRPDVQLVSQDDAVTVLRVSPNGPDVTVILSDGRCTLAVGTWHDDLVSMDVALEYVKLAVEGHLRVRIDQLGGKPWQYALERRIDDGSWREESVMLVPRFTLWARKKTTHYLQNEIVAPL